MQDPASWSSPNTMQLQKSHAGTMQGPASLSHLHLPPCNPTLPQMRETRIVILAALFLHFQVVIVLINVLDIGGSKTLKKNSVTKSV